MPKSINEEFFDAIIRHQIYLMRLSGSIRKRVQKILDQTDEDISDKIRSKLLKHKGLGTPSSVRKLKQLEKYIKSVRTKAWNEVNAVWLEEIIELAKNEPSLVGAALNTVSPVLLDLSLPAPDLLKALAVSQPFEGRTMKQWAASIKAADLRRISDQIKIGMVQGEPSDVIARRVADATNITRHQAAAITRTAVNHIGNAAKREFYKHNKDIFTGELYVATLDSRTTPVCRAHDGKIFDVGKGPIPPLHFNCRSTRVGIVDDIVVGDRPNKPVTEKQLLREYAQKEGIKAPTTRAGLPRGHKGAFDKFQAVRTRELVGQVPAKVSYQDWLKGQTTEFQNDVLGVTKARLFRKGDLTLDKFINRTGDELTLKELAKKHAGAFKAAGLDVEDYL